MLLDYADNNADILGYSGAQVCKNAGSAQTAFSVSPIVGTGANQGGVHGATANLATGNVQCTASCVTITTTTSSTSTASTTASATTAVSTSSLFVMGFSFLAIFAFLLK